MIDNQPFQNKLLSLTALALAFLNTSASAQNPPERVAKEDAALVVDGVVRQVFRSPRQSRTDYLVLIEVQRSDARRVPKTATKPHFPGPGELIYVHAFQSNNAGLFGKVDGFTNIPAERSAVKAYLVAREPGVWEGTYPDWIDVTSDRTVAAGPTDPAPAVVETNTNRANVSGLGLTTEQLSVKNQLVLRVKSVERGSPAQAAGLEVGDVIIGAKGELLKSADQLDQLARGGAPFQVIVMDVNTGKSVPVEIRPGQKPGETKPAESAPAPAERRSLGVAAEPVSVGQRTALKVTRVEEGSPAKKAGIEPGDIIVAANGAPITGPEQLGNALRKSGSKLTLMVRDSRTGREVPVDINIGGGNADSGKVINIEIPELTAKKGRLGAVTELTFYDVEAALKVTEVEAGGPAAKAGLVPGILILEADGKPVLQPNELNDAVRNSAGTMELKVVDPKTGKKGTVKVQLQ